MNKLYHGEDTSAFDEFVAGFASMKMRPVTEVISLNISSQQLARELERGFARLDEISRRLKSRHNDCTPLFLLPMECIGAIVDLVASVEPPQWNAESDGERIPNTLGWIRLGHVCQRLSSIVIGMRTLWASSSFSLSPASVPEIVARAGGLPLTIDLAGRSRQPPDVTKIIHDHIHNAAVIKLGGETFRAPLRNRPWPFDPDNLKDEHFPFLERLSLEREDNNEIYSGIYYTMPMNAPRLRHVFLKDAFVPCALASLESYELQYVDYEFTATLPPLTVLVDMLRNLSNVRVLTLDSCIPIITSNARVHMPTLKFPRLHKLCLGGSMRTVQSLWTCLRVPAETRVQMLIREDPTRRQDTLPKQLKFLDAVGTHFQSPDCPPIVALSINDNQEDNYESLRLIFATPAPGAQQSTLTGPLASGYDFVFDLDFVQWTENFDEPSIPFLAILKHVHSAFKLQKLEVLDLSPASSFTPKQWRETLAPFTDVTTLALESFPPPQGIWHFLCPRIHSIPPAFPKLKIILVEEMEDFYGDSWGEEEGATEYEIDIDMSAELSSILPGFKRRAVAGLGISRFGFAHFTAQDKNAAEQALQELRTVVPEVVGEVSERVVDEYYL